MSFSKCMQLNKNATEPFVQRMLETIVPASSTNTPKIQVDRHIVEPEEDEAGVISYWRDEYDPIFLHQLDARLGDCDDNGGARYALSRWYVNDRKGKHLCKYLSGPTA